MDDTTLDQSYRDAFASEDYSMAAEYLNGFSLDDIHLRLSELDAQGTQDLHQGALDNPRLGSESNVARLTKTERNQNFDDDPNMVYAGENFRIKMLDGFSIGEIGGASAGLFALWDVDNRRRAFYRYNGVMACAGVPLSDSGEGDWSNVFSPAKPTQVDQFAGEARFGQASVAAVGFWSLALPAQMVAVDVPTLFSKSFGIESGAGYLSLVSGSVEVFEGP